MKSKNKKLRDKKSKRKSKKKIIFYTGIIILLLLFYVGLYQSKFKSMPEGTSFEGEERFVSEDSVEFLYDLKYINESGELVVEQEIFDKIFNVIDNAEEFITIDMFLMLFSEKNSYRNLSRELEEHLVEKKKNNPDIKINLITDVHNTGYYSFEHPYLKEMQKNDINVIFTNMDRMRDSNPIYSSFWRVFIQWFGDANYNCEKSLIQSGGEGNCIRSLLRMVNAKVNHRKVIIADNYVEGEKKIVTIITSANPDAHGSDYNNVAYFAEKSVADFSGEFLENDFEGVYSSNSNDVSIQLLTEGKIKDSLIKEINNAEEGEEINLAMFLLTERDIINSLKKAANRGVEIRIIMDPSKYLFGTDSKGIPNRVVAKELIEDTNGKIKLRYYDTHGEEFHSKMTFIKKNDGRVIIFLGSANLTKRNIGNFNLEENVKVIGNIDMDFVQEIFFYFDRIWNNKEGNYTIPYDSFKESSFKDTLRYRFQEKTGLSAF